MKKTILLLIVALAGIFVGIFIGHNLRKEKPPGSMTEKVETVYDTIPYYAPMPQSELAIGTHLYTLPTYCFLGTGAGGEPRCSSPDANAINLPDTTLIVPAYYGTGAGGEPRCSGDSTLVELPIIQKHYADSTYEAWVSGPLDPRLDSLKVFLPTTIIMRKEWKPPKRWHIGVTAGYGYGSKGFQPYIGVGLTYSIFSF